MARAGREAILGLRARTARAIAVLLAEGGDGLAVVHRGEIATADPEHADSRQPHHAGLDLADEEAGPVVAAAEAAVARAAHANLGTWLRARRGEGFRVVACGIAGPPERDPAGIGNPHVRAHAAEGQLFRGVLERAAARRRLPWLRLDDRRAWDDAAAALSTTPAALRRQLAGLGAEIGPPWRADQKLASLAALVALARR